MAKLDQAALQRPETKFLFLCKAGLLGHLLVFSGREKLILGHVGARFPGLLTAQIYSVAKNLLDPTREES